MGLRKLDIKNEYRSLKDNITLDFYIPLLQQAVSYQRAVGYFSSSALIEISKGISGLVQNGGKIQIVASPYLSDEDITAIQKGYELRDEIIKCALIRELNEGKNLYEQERLNLLANLISDGVLDIKIAFTEHDNNLGMYHEKMGIISDQFGNTVAFSGSMNESATAMLLNYEAIDVFCSWKGEEHRVKAKEEAFSSIWNDCEPNIRTVNFPSIKQEIIDRYKKAKPNFNIDLEEYSGGTQLCDSKSIYKKGPLIPDDIELYDYQAEAIENWEQNGFKGIFDMATGTGKTFTGLAALVKLSQKLSNKLGIVIVCPYQHLVEQWVEDIEKFNFKPLICYSGYDWKRDFKNTIEDFNLGVLKSFCIVTTNATLASDYFQKYVDKIKGNACLVVDEAHNFGARKQLECMKEVFKYRLALSATLERHHDPIGTQRLKNYFGEKCIEYTLERAIKENKLTSYYYHPIPVYLEDDEFEQYQELSEKIRRISVKHNRDSPLPKALEMLLIQRARIVAGARQKLKALYDLIKEKHLHDNHLLIYCGATSAFYNSYIEGKVENEEKRQLDAVIEMLGNGLNMRVTKFTSEESAQEREEIKQNFADGHLLQALVAIRCLDEGVNIPRIKTAFILASSTNPKEYIQRRGRVLRKAPNKDFARIYDFVTLPRNIDNPYKAVEIDNCEYSLIRREKQRVVDFAELAINSSEADGLLWKIEDYYKLNYIRGGIEYEF